ncbi:phospholipase A2, membrane associated-like [Acomys russatus]|uniref:phospholipase A2, membrane associated-like n=1 Tax=Acomys russatus TaxID=60746 RepID=UPI0021E2296C|nr:phospholipase A2, membrane associated-like [Acomys russatus]
MKVLLLLAAMIVTFGPIQIQGILKEFNEMVTHLTARSATEFSNYGCHCGPVGKGTPRDGTDRCCLQHRCCYEDIQRYGCNTKYLSYNYTINGPNINCYVPVFRTGCQTQLCKCDRIAAECFARNMKTYKPEYLNYKEEFCNGMTPKCCDICFF